MIKSILRYLVTISLTLAGLWLVGLLVFVGFVQMQPLPTDPKADGIVVLTGGDGRVAVGLQLLGEGRAQRLLISGVHAETNKQNLLPAQGQADKANAKLLTCCVDLGYAAGSTVGNAEEASAWAAQHAKGSLIVVTAAYHVPRTRLEFAQAMPETALIFYPIYRDNVKLDSTWREPWRIPGTVQLIAVEYSKYLFAVGRSFSKYLPL